MAETMNNADKLISRITEAAREEAKQSLDAASAECERIALIAENDVFEIEGEAKAKMQRSRDSIMERSRTNAALDSRKYALAARRAVVGEAFDAAYKKLLALDEAKRAALIEKVLLSEAEGGETIRPAKADEAIVARAVEKANAQLKPALKVGPVSAEAEGGFILVAEGYEKNCSFASMLHEARAASESEVAAILFD